jgi:hypothetical protein
LTESCRGGPLRPPFRREIGYQACLRVAASAKAGDQDIRRQGTRISGYQGIRIQRTNANALNIL